MSTTGGKHTTRRSRIVRALSLTLAMTATLLTTSVTTADAQLDENGTFLANNPTDCPQLTDSIFRLYTAYFGRVPDEGGWAYWNDLYANTDATLDAMSNFFAGSPEFINTYGSLDNTQFVQLVYSNVLGRQPEADGLAFWVNKLETDSTRGAVMIAFSESEEYVNRTSTVAPAAGWFRWYQPRVQYDCGRGDMRSTARGPAGHVDIMLFNTSNFPVFFNFYTTRTGGTDFLQSSATVDGGATYIIWNANLAEIRDDGVRIDLPESVVWSVVHYDQPHDSVRPPWTDGSGVARTQARTSFGLSGVSGEPVSSDRLLSSGS